MKDEQKSLGRESPLSACSFSAFGVFLWGGGSITFTRFSNPPESPESLIRTTLLWMGVGMYECSGSREYMGLVLGTFKVLVNTI